MRLLRYSLLRLLILAVVAGVLYLVGMRSWLLGVAAVLIAALVSFVLLPGARRGAAEDLAGATRRREGAQDDARAAARTEKARRRRARERADEDAEDQQIDGSGG